jgi:hypothetical protein
MSIRGKTIKTGEDGVVLIIVWSDTVKGKMKINYRRYWTRSRISLGLEGSRPALKEVVHV